MSGPRYSNTAEAPAISGQNVDLDAEYALSLQIAASELLDRFGVPEPLWGSIGVAAITSNDKYFKPTVSLDEDDLVFCTRT